MDIAKFDLRKHCADRLASLILSAYGDEMSLDGKYEKTRDNVRNLILLGNNFIGHENIYLSLDDEHITGLCIGYRGKSGADLRTLLALLLRLRLNDLFNQLIVNSSMLDSGHAPALELTDFYISLIAVDKNHRRKGIGGQLIRNALSLAADLGCERLVLDVREDNEAAISLYGKLGFDFIGERSPAGKEAPELLRMERRIEDGRV